MIQKQCCPGLLEDIAVLGLIDRVSSSFLSLLLFDFTPYTSNQCFILAWVAPCLLFYHQIIYNDFLTFASSASLCLLVNHSILDIIIITIVLDLL
jgi:hypothetical protein